VTNRVTDAVLEVGNDVGRLDLDALTLVAVVQPLSGDCGALSGKRKGPK